MKNKAKGKVQNAKCKSTDRRVFFYFRLWPFALCILTFFSGPPVKGQVAITAKAPQETARTAPLDDRILPFVVQLVSVGPANQQQNRACSATAFLIDEQGYLITNAHVVEDAKRCLDKAPGAKILAKLAITDSRTAQAVPCEVIGIDVSNDVALLKVERPLVVNPGDRPAYALLDTREVAVGTAVRVSGYPAFSWQPVTQAGHVKWRGKTRLEENSSSLRNSSDALDIDIHLRPGNSGSPVYRPGGGVIAVVDMRNSLQPSHSVAVSIHYAIELAERFGVPWHGID